ncbi:MAG: MATE family efflux transporter [Deltaproteobacteria bacterium]|nr:MATE family efflux transporter [Deltaproteobacteria bacterium]
MLRWDKWKELLRLAFPVVISKLSFTFMGLVDTAMVGHLGADEQAAAGFAVVYLFTLYVFGLGTITSVNTLVSQNDGAGNFGRCWQVVRNGLFVSIAMGGITWAALLMSKPVFHMLGLNAALCDMAYDYLFYRSFGILGVFGYWVYNSFYEGIGKTRIPMIVTLWANVMNIVFDYGLIFGIGPLPAMGLKGAGLATALCNLFMFGLLALLLQRNKTIARKYRTATKAPSLEWALQRKMIRLGLPMGAQMFLEVGAFLAFTTFAGWAGNTELAASQIAMRIMSITFMSAWGVSIATTTQVGRHQGENRTDLAALAVGRSLLLVCAGSLLVAAVCIFGRNLIIPLFTPVAEVQKIALQLIAVASLFAIFDGVNMVSYGALRGAGDTVWPLYNVGIMHWLVGIPLVYALTIPMHMGAFGNWLGMAIMMCVQAILMVYRVKSGKWKQIRLVTQTA